MAYIDMRKYTTSYSNIRIILERVRENNALEEINKNIEKFRRNKQKH